MLSWGLQTDPLCLFCNDVPESIEHCFFECRFTWPIWKVIAEKCKLRPTRRWNPLLAHLTATVAWKHQKTLSLLGWQATLTLCGQREITESIDHSSLLRKGFLGR
ncbi:hypothetical protein Rs2_24031 [Raphanus sativus]|nr:hypothetical protein Rs2_24031 [Raphanus sativus]